MEIAGRVIDPDGLTPACPEMSAAVWSGVSVVWRRAPFTPQPIKMPTTGVSVAFIGDQGSQSRRGGGSTRTRRLEPGSVFVFADDDFIWEENVTPYAGVALRFDQTLLSDFAARIGYGGSTDLRSSHFRPDGRLIAITKLMAEELRSSGMGGAVYQDSLINLAAVHLLRHYTSAEGIAGGRPYGLTTAKLKLVGEYIRTNLAGDIRLEDLASIAGMSAFHFARSFRDATGRPPHRHVIDLRMARAKELLASSALPISEIAWRVGYANQSHFTAQFKRAVGMTPGRFRSSL